MNTSNHAKRIGEERIFVAYPGDIPSIAETGGAVLLIVQPCTKMKRETAKGP